MPTGSDVTERELFPSGSTPPPPQFVKPDLRSHATGSSGGFPIEGPSLPTYLIIAKARKIAAHLLEVSEADIEFKEGVFLHTSTTHRFGIDQPRATWLAEAMQELGDACVEAAEEGYQPVSSHVRASAESLLSDLASRVSEAPVVHSTPEGGIAIDFRNAKRDAALMILCDPNGEGACFYDVGDKQGRARCTDVRDLLVDAGWSAVQRIGLV